MRLFEFLVPYTIGFAVGVAFTVLFSTPASGEEVLGAPGHLQRGWTLDRVFEDREGGPTDYVYYRSICQGRVCRQVPRITSMVCGEYYFHDCRYLTDEQYESFQNNTKRSPNDN